MASETHTRPSPLEAGFAGLLAAGSGAIGYACWQYSLTHDTSVWIGSLTKPQLNIVMFPSLGLCLAFALKGQSWVDRHAARMKERGLRAITGHRSLLPAFPQLAIFAFLAYSAPFWSDRYEETLSSVIFPAAERPTSVSVLLYVNGLLGMLLMLCGTVVALDEMGLATGSKLIRFIDWVASAGTKRVSFFKILDAKYYLNTAQLAPMGAVLFLTNKGPVFAGGYLLGALSMLLLLLATRGTLPDKCGVRQGEQNAVPTESEKKPETRALSSGLAA